MTIRHVFAGACALVLATAPLALADDDHHSPCHDVAGRILWSVIPAPNEPFGRVLGSATGSLEGPTTDSILAFETPPGVVPIKTHDFPIFMTGPHDQLYGDAHATFTPTANPAIVDDEQTIAITGGTGKFEGATGTIHAKGHGHNLLTTPPPDQAGQVFFNLAYWGEVCLAK